VHTNKVKTQLFLLAVFLVVIFSFESIVKAGNVTSLELLQWCEAGLGSNPDSFNLILCTSYITGVGEGYGTTLTHIYPSRDRLICLPNNVTRGQAARVVLKYLKNNPETLHYLASYQTLVALQKAFPCKKEGE